MIGGSGHGGASGRRALPNEYVGDITSSSSSSSRPFTYPWGDVSAGQVDSKGGNDYQQRPTHTSTLPPRDELHRYRQQQSLQYPYYTMQHHHNNYHNNQQPHHHQPLPR